MFSLSSLSRSVSIARSFLRIGKPTFQPVQTALGPLSLFSRARTQLAPRQVKHLKRHKGRIPIPIGGSTKGRTLAYGEYGIRIKGNGHRLTAKQLATAEEVLKRKARALKGLKVFLRVFPDIPVCIKVNFNIMYVLRVITCLRVTKLVWVKVKERSSIGQLGPSYLIVLICKFSSHSLVAFQLDVSYLRLEAFLYVKNLLETVCPFVPT